MPSAIASDVELIDCLASWPPGTVGRAKDAALIRQLILLCREHGYGRIAQLAKALEEIWRFPEQAAHYRRDTERRLALFNLPAEDSDDAG